MKEFRLSNNTIDFIIDSLEEGIMEEGTLEDIICEVLNVDDISDIELYDYIEEKSLDKSLKTFTLEIIRKVEDYLKSHKGETGWKEVR